MAKKGAKRSQGSQPEEGYLPISGGTAKIGDTVGPPPGLIKPVDQKNVPNWGTQNAGKTRSKSNTAPEVFTDKKAKGTIGPVDPMKKGRSVTRGAIRIKGTANSSNAILIKSGPQNVETRVEGQPVYQKITFPTADPSLKGGARRTAWLDKKNRVFIIPNVDRDRLPGGKGGPLYYKISADQLGDIIAEKRGPGPQSVTATDISMFLRSEAKRKSGSRVTPFDINDDLSGFEVQNRFAGYDNISGTNLYRGNAPDEVVFEPRETVKPDIEIDVVADPDKTPTQMIPERQEQVPSDEPRGIYYFEKGRFLTRGKYNGKIRTSQRRG